MAEVEQQRTIAGLLGVLLDNVRRSIRPVHFRDIVATLRSDYAQLHLTAADPTSILSAGTWYKAAGTTALSGSPVPYNFVDGGASNRLQYDGTEGRVVAVNAAYSLTAAASNQVIGFALAKNGVVLTDTFISRKVATAGDVGAASMTGLVELAVGDYVELWVKNDTSGSNVTIQALTMAAIGHAY